MSTPASDPTRSPDFVAPFAAAFDYTRASDPIRSDLAETHRRAWGRLARPGTWWTGAERIAIAAESRAARDCAYCAERRAALSPFAVEGRHDTISGDTLPPAAVDAVHRVATDASRLTSDWIAGLADAGVPDTHYVELLSVLVAVRSIDAFHRAMGLPLEPLPTPLPERESGLPSRRRPSGTESETAWVPMLVPSKLEDEDRDLFPGPMAPNVMRALSLVPDGVRWLKDLSAAHYLPMGPGMMDFSKGRGVLSRAQTELIAGRVSAMNECFY